MKIDFLLGERALPVHVISVRLAATIYAYELGRWNGTDYTEAEIEPFMSLESISDEWRSTTSPHAWESISLEGNPRHAREAIELSICRDVDAGRLPALQVRRDLSGALLVADTILDFDKVRDWGETYELEFGDWWSNYSDDEAGIALKALAAIKDERERLQNPKALETRKERARELNEDGILEILRENERLRAGTNASNERPLDRHTKMLRADARENYLRIIRALLEMSTVPGHGTVTAILNKLRALDFDVDPSKPDVVEKALKAARTLIPENARATRK